MKNDLLASASHSTIDRWTPHRPPFQTARIALAGKRIMILAGRIEEAGRAFLSLVQAGAAVRLVRRQDQISTFVDGMMPELIVLDVESLGARAAEAVRELRRDSRTATVVIVGLAEPHDRAFRSRLRAAGYDELLSKPVDANLFAQQLVDAVPRLASSEGSAA